MDTAMGDLLKERLKFDSAVLSIEVIDGKTIVKCAPTIYEIKLTKKGKLYKRCLSNRAEGKKYGMVTC